GLSIRWRTQNYGSNPRPPICRPNGFFHPTRPKATPLPNDAFGANPAGSLRMRRWQSCAVSAHSHSGDSTAIFDPELYLARVDPSLFGYPSPAKTADPPAQRTGREVLGAERRKPGDRHCRVGLQLTGNPVAHLFGKIEITAERDPRADGGMKIGPF